MGTESLTQVLDDVRAGVDGARDRLVELAYAELHHIAAAYVAKERVGATIQATELVNEAFMRVMGRERVGLENRRHLFAAFSNAMREVLIDAARRRNAIKRGGDRRKLPLGSIDIAVNDSDVDVLTVDKALQSLETEDPRAAEVVRLRFFAGLPERVIAELLDVSEKTVQRDWSYAKAFMRRLMSAEDAS